MSFYEKTMWYCFHVLPKPLFSFGTKISADNSSKTHFHFCTKILQPPQPNFFCICTYLDNHGKPLFQRFCTWTYKYFHIQYNYKMFVLINYQLKRNDNVIEENCYIDSCCDIRDRAVGTRFWHKSEKGFMLDLYNNWDLRIWGLGFLV